MVARSKRPPASPTALLGVVIAAVIGSACTRSGFVTRTGGGGSNDAETHRADGGGPLDAGVDGMADAGLELSDVGADGSAVSWLTGWSSRRRLTFDRRNAETDLFDFPVRVTLDGSRISYAALQPQGQDLRFTTSNGTQLLAHEVERWNTDGVSVVWVKVARIPSAAETSHIWMYYGNEQASDQQRAAEVWDDGFLAVYHLADTADVARDSTRHGYHGSYLGAPARAQEGRSGELAVRFDGQDDSIDLGFLDITAVGGNEALTIEVIAMLDPAGSTDNDPRLLAKATSGTLVSDSHWWMLSLYCVAPCMEADLRARLKLSEAATTQTFFTVHEPYRAGTWIYAVARYDGANFSLLADGRSQLSDSTSSGSIVSGPTVPVSIGENPGRVARWKGLISEVRLSTVARSDAWIVAQQRAMLDSPIDPFLDIGPEERASP